MRSSGSVPSPRHPAGRRQACTAMQAGEAAWTGLLRHLRAGERSSVSAQEPLAFGSSVLYQANERCGISGNVRNGDGMSAIQNACTDSLLCWRRPITREVVAIQVEQGEAHQPLGVAWRQAAAQPVAVQGDDLKLREDIPVGPVGRQAPRESVVGQVPVPYDCLSGSDTGVCGALIHSGCRQMPSRLRSGPMTCS